MEHKKGVVVAITSIVNKDKYSGSQQKIARFIGTSILLVGVLSAIVFPLLGSLVASIGLIGISFLDIAISLGIFKYYKSLKPKLAKATALFRLLHTILLGIAIIYHVEGDISTFNKILGIGLIGFGIHLILLSCLFDQAHEKKWIHYSLKGLLIIAGIGYIILHSGALLLDNTDEFASLVEKIFIVPMIFGEIFYAFWMILKEGRNYV